MDRIQYFAGVSVRRACGFGVLAIVTMVSGFAPIPLLAVKLAATLTTLMGVILALKALHAPKKPYRRTELWILLGKKHGLPEARAQRVLMGTLQGLYIAYAEVAGWVALALWGAALILQIALRSTSLAV